ncbi:uncharacterized protein METZ01_LOCUS12387 [marine metagenome]|uniref:Uncharacterized protein n=1 Tax=marine metagenome TaxID=408172 RepID=A0A381P1I2_9ZZZZ
MITTVNLAILGLSIFGWVAITAPDDCPPKYMKTIEKGGELVNSGDISTYCYTSPLPYGKYYWALREEYEEEDEE